MRLFIAIELTKDLQNKLSTLQDKLKLGLPDVKWVAPENIHLTLKFLGETEETKIILIKDILNQATAKFKEFSLEISGLGAFTNLKNPRVIWIGATEEYKNILTEIVGIIEAGLEKIGFAKEKRGFQSHITLGRVRSGKNINALKDSLIKNAEFKAGIFKIASISLIQSKLNKKEPVYTNIHTAKLLAATA